MNDEAFLTELANRPDDMDQLVVYADWLETQGDLPRAHIVRTHHQLKKKLAGKDEGRIPTARALLDRSTGQSREWLARLAPSIEGTSWGSCDTGGSIYLVRFAPKGVLQYKQGEPGDPCEEGEDTGHGWWMQVGNAIVYSIAAHDDADEDFSRQEGIVYRKRMWGVGSDADNDIWRWKMRAVTQRVFEHDRFPKLDGPTDSELISVKAGSKKLLVKRRW